MEAKQAAVIIVVAIFAVALLWRSRDKVKKTLGFGGKSQDDARLK